MSGIKKNRVLVVDDEPAIVDLVRQILLRSGYEVRTAVDGDSAYQAVYDLKPDLVILDLMLPVMDGWEVCRRVKSDPEVNAIPILMLTARRDERDVVEGLELGADDYVKKPFSTEELRARVAVLLRRSGKTGPVRELREGDLVLDIENESADLRGRELSLSRTEFQLLALLAERFGRRITRESLQSSIWNTLDAETRAIDVHVSRLRKKLEDGGEPALLVQSQRGRGYRLVWETK
ncbi:MAG: response regulator transcription factor [Synergistaceae bacterium]|jgi:two-component system phosphate regulon response regulator PhoB/two-component system alkaline phosphatase synthesis response regulator PhoP|nr:response regulator transcription factor [Synergistaceae bacterium]